MSVETPEVSDERIYADLRQYQEAGVFDYVLPTDPLGEQWIIGWRGEILKFVTKEGVIGFLMGIAAGASFGAKAAQSGSPENLRVRSLGGAR